MKTLMRNGQRPSIGKPAWVNARKERVFLFGTDQRITSGPAVKTAALTDAMGRRRGNVRTSIVADVNRWSSPHANAERPEPISYRPEAGQHTDADLSTWLELQGFLILI